MDFEKFNHYMAAEHMQDIVNWLEKYGYDFVEKENLGYDVTHIMDTLNTLIFVLRDRPQ